MARLPSIGGDEDDWGSVLNEYLAQAHKEDGTLKADVKTILSLRQVDVRSVPDGSQVIVAGYHIPGDRGGGSFYYHAAARDADDGGAVIAPSSGNGRWKRGSAASDGVVRPEQFGARGAGADDTDALVKMAAFTNSSDQPASVTIGGLHRTSKTIQFNKPGLMISGSGKIIKGGPISTDRTSDTDTVNASSILTLAGEGQKLIGITVSDEDRVDGAKNGYGRAAIAVVASHCLILGVSVIDCVQGIQVAWSSEGFVQGRGNWRGSEIVGTALCANKILRSRPHHEQQAAVGCGIRSFGSENTIQGNYITADDEHGPGLKLLHGIKIEGLAKRHPDDQNSNDRGGVISGNIVIGPFRHSIYVEAVDGVTIDGNIVRKSGREAISFQGANTVVSNNVVDVGGYFDGNPACGIRTLNGKTYTIADNIIRPWRNERGSLDQYKGILIGANNGHGAVRGNLITRNASVVTRYKVKDAAGQPTRGAKFVTAADGSDRFRMVGGFGGNALTVTQGSGWFDVGTKINQPASGWSAIIAAWDDPVDARLDVAIDAGGLELTIDDNRIERGVARVGVSTERGANIRVRRNLIQGYMHAGIEVKKYSGDLIIEGNEIGESLSATGDAVSVLNFEGTPGLICIRGNKFLRNATALRFGEVDMNAGQSTTVVADNDFFGNKVDIKNQKPGTILYSGNTGVTTSSGGKVKMPAGRTSATVPHRLIAAPARVLVTPRGNVGAVWVSSVGDTEFTCNCESAPSTDTIVDWTAEVLQPQP